MKAALFALALVACGPANASRREVVNDDANAYCARAQACGNLTSSVAQCVADFSALFPNDAANDDASSCTETELSQCTDAISKEDCAALQAGTLPTSCKCL